MPTIVKIQDGETVEMDCNRVELHDNWVIGIEIEDFGGDSVAVPTDKIDEIRSKSPLKFEME